MNKYILDYSQKLDESIGRGSVLLIKGKPTKEGRFLYVTTIKGYVEIRPGLKMVFIDDNIHRVIHKGGDKFSGVLVGLNDAALKGVLNMKNQNRPSVVLNNNKTPFHWLTLKHNDIGKALRSLGSSLFLPDLILESSNDDPNVGIIKEYFMTEFYKLMAGKSSGLKLKAILDEDGEEKFKTDDPCEESGESSVIDVELVAYFDCVLNRDNTPDEMRNTLIDVGFEGLDTTFDELGIGELFNEDPNDDISFNVNFNVEYTMDIGSEAGDSWTPGSSWCDTESIETTISTVNLEFNYRGLNLNNETTNLNIEGAREYEKIIDDMEPDAIITHARTIQEKE